MEGNTSLKNHFQGLGALMGGVGIFAFVLFKMPMQYQNNIMPMYVILTLLLFIVYRVLKPYTLTKQGVAWIIYGILLVAVLVVYQKHNIGNGEIKEVGNYDFKASYTKEDKDSQRALNVFYICEMPDGNTLRYVDSMPKDSARKAVKEGGVEKRKVFKVGKQYYNTEADETFEEFKHNLIGWTKWGWLIAIGYGVVGLMIIVLGRGRIQNE